MKTLISVFTALIVLFSSCQKDDDAVDFAPVSGNLKLKSVLLYGSVEAEKPIAILEEYEYDQIGRISKVSSPMYNAGKITGVADYRVYEYNEDGRLAKIIYYTANANYPSGFVNLQTKTFEYSEDGRKTTEYTEFPVIKSFEYLKYHYFGDEMVKMEKYNHLNVMESKVVYAYNAVGQAVEEKCYAANNQLISLVKHNYHKGLLVRTDVFGGRDLEPIRKITRTYDQKNNLKEEVSLELASWSSLWGGIRKFEYYDN